MLKYYGCKKCKTVHFEGEAIYLEHLRYKNIYGIKTATSEDVRNWREAEAAV